MNYQKLLRQMIGVKLVMLFLVGCDAAQATPTPDRVATSVAEARAVAATLTAEVPAAPTPVLPTSPPTFTPTPASTSTEERRPLTYYSAKQAFARLALYLREKGQPSPEIIWQAIPERTAVYPGSEFDSYLGIVGGWFFQFEDRQGKQYGARVNCWGEIAIEENETDFANNYLRGIQLDEWVLDHIDAHMEVLSHGGRSNADRFGGWLMAANVEGRGIRPVWAGGAWFMPDEMFSAIMVDAQTGELYRPTSTEALEPAFPEQEPAETEWDGGFDEESIEAFNTWSQDHYWPSHAYENSERWFIYNRRLFQSALQEQLSESSRNASSWMTSGVLHSALGEWIEAIDDYSQAIQMAPDHPDYRYYRGLSFLVIRDLDKALSDFQVLPQGYAGRSRALEFVEILRGIKESALSGQMLMVATDIGFIPLQVWLGPIPLASLSE